MARYPRLLSLPNSATRLISDIPSPPMWMMIVRSGGRGSLAAHDGPWIEQKVLPVPLVGDGPQPGVPAEPRPPEPHRLVGALVEDEPQVPVQLVADVVLDQIVEAPQGPPLGE